jgi:hypothetical protein
MTAQEQPERDPDETPTASQRARITDRQAAARRINGRASRGPKTALGKAISRQNARKHGAYAKVIGFTGDRPFETADFAAFSTDILASLPSLATPLLVALGTAISKVLWTILHTEQWTADAIQFVANAAAALWQRDPRLIADLYEVAHHVIGTENLEGAAVSPRAWAITVRVLADRPEINDDDWPDGTRTNPDELPEGEARTLALHFIHKASDGSHLQLLKWIEDERRTYLQEADSQDQQIVEGASHAVLTSALMRTVPRIEAHHATQLRKAYDLYWTELTRYRAFSRDEPDPEA